MSIVDAGSAGSTSGSGGAYASLIESLLAIERRPLTELATRQSRLAVTQGIMSDLGSKLAILRSSLDALRGSGGLSPLNVFDVSSSNSQIVDATAGGAAARGNHRITISQL